MARKRAKRASLRGSRTCSWGRHTKHRGHGSQGVTGLSGGKKQKKTWMVKYMPDRIGKFGFNSLQQRGLRRQIIAVNVSDLEVMAAGKKELDLTSFGFGKVLGAGSIKTAITVKADYFTPQAKKKIEKAGGKAAVNEEKKAE